MSRGRVVVPPYSTTTVARCAALQRGRGGDAQLVLGLVERCLRAVDRHPVGGEPAEVEVEPGEVLGGDEIEGRDGLEGALERRGRCRRRGVVQAEVVVAHVGAAVAGEWEVRVPGAVRAFAEQPVGGPRQGRRGDRSQRDQRHDESLPGTSLPHGRLTALVAHFLPI